jgi:hypothetical protein
MPRGFVQLIFVDVDVHDRFGFLQIVLRRLDSERRGPTAAVFNFALRGVPLSRLTTVVDLFFIPLTMQEGYREGCTWGKITCAVGYKRVRVGMQPRWGLACVGSSTT